MGKGQRNGPILDIYNAVLDTVLTVDKQSVTKDLVNFHNRFKKASIQYSIASIIQNISIQYSIAPIIQIH